MVDLVPLTMTAWPQPASLKVVASNEIRLHWLGTARRGWSGRCTCKSMVSCDCGRDIESRHLDEAWHDRDRNSLVAEQFF
jgi:hypothetical protein